MVLKLTARGLCGLAIAMIILPAVLAAGQASGHKKVFVITDMEGVDGIFSAEDQCVPFTSPRWEESRKLLTGEVNSAVAGLFEGGATEVVVVDGHDSGRTLSALDIDSRVRLMAGRPFPPSLGLDSSYSAMIFVGQHAMAGAKNGVLSHTESIEDVQNLWINGKPVGEIGINLLLASHFGVPTIMLSGDVAACEEIHQLAPQAECAEVKSGVSRTAGVTLSHPAACTLIRDKARNAMKRLAEFKPYAIAEPVELKIEYTTVGTRPFWPRENLAQVDERTWIFRGKNFLDVWERFLSH
jgi:D-amino peptidase